MPIDPSAVGAKGDPVERSWNSKDCLLYAVGVGAGRDYGELDFVYEKDQKVLPTFAVIVGGGGAPMRSIGSFNPAMLVHGEQAIELFGPIPPEGKVKSEGQIVGIYDKGSGAVVVMESTSADATSGKPMFKTRSSMFIRGEGGFGGDRGPSGPRNVPPDRDPDHVVTYETRAEQAAIYRLSGDRNPLHIDPAFAGMGGFEKPILHGLCSYGFTGRALLHALAGSDPSRFRSMEARFSKPVMPGDTLTVKVWVEGGVQEATFRTETQSGDVVIDQGKFTFS